MRKIVLLALCLCLVLPWLSMPAQGEGWAVPGKSALLMEAATGKVLFEQNAHEKLAPASVTKVMTMLLIMEALDSGRISWEEPVTASEAAAAKGGSQIYLKVGESMSVSDMVKSIAVSSANDCACAMAEHIAGSEEAFVALMNQRAQELGMEHTHFVNCTGLDDGEAAKEHRTCAWDIALMSRQLLVQHPKIKEFTTIWMDTVRDGAFGLANTNKLVRFYPGATGLKTGFTSGAGYCLSASARRDGMELIAVVLGCETSQDRFSACKQLLDRGFASYALFSAKLPENAVVPVTLGQKKQVSLVPAGNTQLLVDKGQADRITVHTELSPQIAAPVSQGQRLGTMTIQLGQQILAEIPLVASEAVLRRSWWDIFLEVLRCATMAKT